MSHRAAATLGRWDRVVLTLALVAGGALAGDRPSRGAESWTIESPAGRIEAAVELGDRLELRVRVGGADVLLPSAVDLAIEGLGPVARAGGPPRVSRQEVAEAIVFPVPRRFRELTLRCRELGLAFSDGRALDVRVYDEGVAYRWRYVKDGELTVVDETAEFVFPEGARAWFPEEESLFSHQERQYQQLALAELGPERFGSTPALVQVPGGPKVLISEADLASYPGMFLRGLGEGRSGLAGKYAPYALQTTARNDRDVPVTEGAPYLAKTAGPRGFPWRVLIVAEKDADLLRTELVYALSPPSEIGDPSWIKPGKVAWEWWNAIDVYGVDFSVGINTATYKHFIDFAAENNLQYILLDEGWSADSSDVLSVREGLDLEELVGYGRELGVGVILWVLWNALDAQLEPALDRYQQLGIAGIKVDFMQRDDQWMVEYYHRVAREAARRRLVVDFHGAYKPTGLARQYPNVLTSEGVAGLEQYKWTKEMANPEHELVLPFVRMAVGPMDYTPGAMHNANLRDWRAINDHPMSLGTRCHQLAMYVVYESPLQMLADSPTHYRQSPECLELLAAVPAVWDDTRVLQAQVGDYVALARRSGDEWFIGAMTDWERRTMELSLDFLPDGQYELVAWSDGVNAERNGRDYRRTAGRAWRGDVLTIELAAGGGWAGWLRPAEGATSAAR